MKIANPPSPPFSKGGLGGFETYFLPNANIMNAKIISNDYWIVKDLASEVVSLLSASPLILKYPVPVPTSFFTVVR